MLAACGSAESGGDRRHRRRAPSGCRRSARSTRRSTSPRRRRTTAACSSSSRAARCASSRTARRSARRSSTCSDKITTGSEQGLLSIAFAPDYAASGLFYVFYTDTDGDEAVVEYKRSSEDVADPGSARRLLKVADPEPNHNGGLLLFGPDEQLYIGIGDGGGAGDQHGARGNGQNLGTLLGKILRIDPKASGSRPYTIPSDNPFVNRSGAKGEIYSYGLRNPWRFSFDRSTGDLTIGDVGQNEIEEIDFVRAGKGRGANFGWRPFEGNDRFTPGESAPGAIKPVITEKHSDGNCSITGGVSSATRSCRRGAGATCSATSAAA